MRTWLYAYSMSWYAAYDEKELLAMYKTKKVYAFLILLLAVLALWPALPEASDADEKIVYVIPVDGEITPAMATFLINCLDEANQNKATGIIIEISTLGGRVDSAISMRDAIIDSDSPVVIYIESRAISAGALISIAGDKIVMAPGSHIGAAEPIPNDPKTLAFVRGEFRSTAEKAGRDPQIAEAMVDASIEIEGLVKEGEILDLTANQAYQHGYADLVAKGRQSVLEYMGWLDAEIVEKQFDYKLRIAQFLTSYEVASILLTLGMIGILAELFTPGFGAPGIFGILCFVLYFAGGLIAGSTEWWAAIIFIAGLILLAVEIVAPGFGVFGISGIVALVLGIILSAPTPSQGIGTLAIALAATMIAIPVFIKIFGRTRLFQHLVLSTSETTEMGYIHAPPKNELLGKTGTAYTVLRPAGIVLIDGKRVDAIADGAYIEKGTPVEVIRVEGSKVIVAPLNVS